MSDGCKKDGVIGNKPNGTPDITDEEYIPIKRSFIFQNSPLRYDPDLDVLISTKSLQVPPGTVILGQNTAISAGGRDVNFDNIAYTIRGVLNPITYNEFGSDRMQDHRYGVFLNLEEQLLEDAVSPTDPFTFQIPVSNDQKVVEVQIKGNVASIGAIFEIRVGSPTGPLLLSQENIEVLAPPAATTVVLQNPMAQNFGDQLFATIFGAEVKGTFFGPDFAPYAIAKGHIITMLDVLTEEDWPKKQIKRSGVETSFSVEAVVANTKIQFTADDESGFTIIYFNPSPFTENTEGSLIGIPDNIIDVPFSPISARYHVSTDALGNLQTTTVKTGSSTLVRVHLFSYTAVNGVAIAVSLLANPFVSYSDKTYQGVLNVDGGRVDDLTIFSPNNGTLELASTAFSIVANATNFELDKIDPHSRNIPGKNPLNWTYLTQLVTTIPDVGTSTLLDPLNWDDGGTLTPITGSPNQSTVQAVYISPVSEFAILYGQVLFPTFDDALLNAESLIFELPTGFFEVIEIARIVIQTDALDSADTTRVSIIDTTQGGGGGTGTQPQTSVFFDGDFLLKNSTDATKTAQFEASKQLTSTLKIHKLPEDSSELATIDLKETMGAAKLFPASLFQIIDDVDITKEARFDASAIPTSTINTYEYPANQGEIVVDLPSHSVTELSDVDDAGSGDIITDAERFKLQNIEDGAKVNVQSDWDETDTGDDAYIKNKPTPAIDGKEDFTFAGKNNLGDQGVGQIRQNQTRWYRISSTVDGVTAVINASYVLNTQEGSENQSTRFTICMQNRDPNFQPVFTLLANHSFNSTKPVKAVRLVADQASGTNDAFHVEVQISNDSGDGDGFIKIHDRTFHDNQTASFFLVPDAPISPARVVKEWTVGSLAFNANEAFTVDNNDNIAYGSSQGPVRKITGSVNAPFSFAHWFGGTGTGDQATRNGVLSNDNLGDILSDSDLTDFGMIRWTWTGGTDQNASKVNDIVNGVTVIDIVQSGENDFAFRLAKSGWYDCELSFKLEGLRSATNFAIKLFQIDSSNRIIQLIDGAIQIKNETRHHISTRWSGFFGVGDAFCAMKTAGTASDLQTQAHRFQIKCNCEV